MSQKRQTRSKQPSTARKARTRPPAKPGLLSDDDSIELRRRRAETEKAAVKAIRKADSFYGTYEVGSVQWDQPYIVEVRSLRDRINTCTCRDFRTNRLGTCKHIERVLIALAHRRQRLFAQAAEAGSPLYEIYLDMRPEPPVIRLDIPARRTTAVDRLLTPFFSADGTLLGDPVDAFPALQRTIAKAGARAKQQIHSSHIIEEWVHDAPRRRERSAARKAFLEDVRAGKRTLDPVRHPLYPYQQEGMLHLAFGERAMLADEMGLGKTVQAIAACELLHQTRGLNKTLIVCPASLKAEWEEQIRHFTGRQARLLLGSRATRLRTYREDHFFLIANYEQVRGDVDDINRFLTPDVVILDEAQRIKNWPTKTAKSIKRLQSPYAFVLTGTPLENRVEEIYSLIEFLDPQVFGSLFRFQREFFEVDDDGNVAYRNLAELHRRVNSVMLRRRKDDVEGELPERTVKTFFVPMHREQRLRYEDHELSAARLIALAKKRPLTKQEFERLQILLACMRMVCDTPYILDSECRVCPKLEELEALLDDALADPTAKAIVFSEWVRMLDLVKELAAGKGIGFALHTGKVDQRRRRDEIHRFKKDPDCRLFLSSEAGGTGLNLQAANIVINLDLPWNPAKLEQRIARSWRKHQTRPVTVINLVTEHSIEHQMLDKLAFKQRLAESVVDGRIPEGGLKVERGRKAFLSQINALMGTHLETGATAAEKSPEVPPVRSPERLRQDLTARFPTQVLGIECTADERSILVIARHTEDTAKVREAAATSAPNAHIEVLDRDTFELLQRLNERGIIAFTGKTQPVFRSPEMESAAPSLQPRPFFPVEAAACMKTASRKRRIAAVLAGGELYAEALPPATEAYATALQAVHAYCHGQPPETPVQPVEADRLRDSIRLPDDLGEHISRLAACNPQHPSAAALVTETLRIIDRIEARIRADQPSA